jgi:hypothetical protein
MKTLDHELVPSSLAEIKARARAVSEAMKAAAGKPLPPDLRKRFIEVRAALFQRGVFDPVLVRFDSATAPPAPIEEIADQLASVAASL